MTPGLVEKNRGNYTKMYLLPHGRVEGCHHLEPQRKLIGQKGRKNVGKRHYETSSSILQPLIFTFSQ